MPLADQELDRFRDKYIPAHQVARLGQVVVCLRLVVFRMCGVIR